MKKIILLLIFLIIIIEFKSKLYSKPPKLCYKSKLFKIRTTRYHVMYPGMPESPINHDFSWSLKMRRKAFIRFDSAWGDGYAMEVFENSQSSVKSKLRKRRTIVRLNAYYSEIRYEISIEPEKPKFTSSKKQIPPVNHDGRLLFRYYINDTPYYFSILYVEAIKDSYAP